jgi:hypothetical protein
MSVRSFLALTAIVWLLGVGQLSGAEMTWGTGTHGEALSLQQVRQSVLVTPIPQFSFDFRRRRISGSGIFEMRINPKTGKMKDVIVPVSTRNAILDNELARVCSMYQFKPGRITQARVPMGFVWTRAGSRSAESKWVY